MSVTSSEFGQSDLEFAIPCASEKSVLSTSSSSILFPRMAFIDLLTLLTSLSHAPDICGMSGGWKTQLQSRTWSSASICRWRDHEWWRKQLNACVIAMQHQHTRHTGLLSEFFRQHVLPESEDGIDSNWWMEFRLQKLTAGSTVEVLAGPAMLERVANLMLMITDIWYDRGNLIHGNWRLCFVEWFFARSVGIWRRNHGLIGRFFCGLCINGYLSSADACWGGSFYI